MQRTTSSISLEIALQQGTEQVFVRRDNISLGDMPTTSKLGPMSPLQTSCLNVYWAEQRQQDKQEVRDGIAQRRKHREGCREHIYWVQGKKGTRAQLDQYNPNCLIITASDSECIRTIWKSIGVAHPHHQWATLLDAHTQETKYIKRKKRAAVILRPPCF